MSFYILDKEIDYGRCCVYELIVCKIFSKLGNEGYYEKSTLLSNKMLKESLRLNRMYAVMDCLYNSYWNYKELNSYTKDPEGMQKSILELRKCLILSQITRNEPWEKFFQQKIEEIYFN